MLWITCLYIAAVKDRPVLVIGGGEIAARKITFLRRTGLHVQIVAKRLESQLQWFANQQAVHWLVTEFDETQLDAVFLVFAAINDAALNRRVLRCCQQAASAGQCG